MRYNMIHFPVSGDAFNVVLDSLSERIADCWSYLWLLAELTVNYDKDWDTGTSQKTCTRKSHDRFDDYSDSEVSALAITTLDGLH